MERSDKITNVIPQNEVIDVKPIKNEAKNTTESAEYSKIPNQKETQERKKSSEIQKTSKSSSPELGVLTCVKIAKWYAKAYGATHVDTNE